MENPQNPILGFLQWIRKTGLKEGYNFLTLSEVEILDALEARVAEFDPKPDFDGNLPMNLGAAQETFITPEVMADLFGRGAIKGQIVVRVWMSVIDFAGIRKRCRDIFDPTTDMAEVKKGIQGVMWNAQIRTTEKVKPGFVVLICDGEGDTDLDPAWTPSPAQLLRISPPTRTSAPKSTALTFEQAWAEKERQGYQYGHDALEQVRMGWEMAHGTHLVNFSPGSRINDPRALKDFWEAEPTKLKCIDPYQRLLGVTDDHAERPLTNWTSLTKAKEAPGFYDWWNALPEANPYTRGKLYPTDLDGKLPGPDPKS